MKGMRKVGIAVVIGVIAAAVPLSPEQAGVLEVLALATMGANGLEHIGGAIAGANVRRNGNPGNAGSVPRIPDEEE